MLLGLNRVSFFFYLFMVKLISEQLMYVVCCFYKWNENKRDLLHSNTLNALVSHRNEFEHKFDLKKILL